MQIAATMPVKRDSRGWIVPSQTAPSTTYRVAPMPVVVSVPDTGGLGCTCPDFQLRGKACKHVIAVEFTMRRETVTDGAVVTEQVKVTYTQDWRAYNLGQTQEKELLLPMLADLCGTLSRPYKGRGRPCLPMSDMAYAAVTKVYSGMSARRFDTDVREAKDRGLTEVDPHFNTVLRYLRNPELTPVLRGLVTLSALPFVGVESTFAQDSTGFSTSTYARWFDHKWGKEQTKRQWVKLHAMTGTQTNIVTDANVTNLHGADSPQFIPLLRATAENFAISEVSADKAYSSKANLQAAADLGATPYVPFKGAPVIADPAPPQPWKHATAWVRMYHQFTYQRDTFLAHYHRRSNVETTFSMIKRKFGESLKSKSETGQVNEVLCKVIAHNLAVVISAIYELGLETPRFAPAPNLELVG
jgi:transposase